MKTKIPISDAKKIADKGFGTVIIFGINDNGDSFTITTYGKTKALCRHAGDMSKKISKAIFDRVVEPALIEPLDVPNQPTQWE